MTPLKDYYIILGVPPEATAKDVKIAYRRAARRFHPDANNHPGASAQFRDIAEAYEILGNWSARNEYDILRRRDGIPHAYYDLRVTPSKRALKLLSEPQVLYVLAEFIPNTRYVQPQGQGTPLNVALVIDRSTSMTGVRLDRVKQAAHRIIDNLSPDDTLSVIAFSDRAEVVVAATPVVEISTLKAMVSTMQTGGATEIFRGLKAGVEELKHSLNPKYVNHLILLTDGRTYGDEEQCLALADELLQEGIGISAVGIGQEWNDEFLDNLASRTGGASTYINSPANIVSFLNDRIRSLGAAFAERVRLSVAPDSDISLESAFKLTPHPQPLSTDHQAMPLGGLEANRPISVLLQLQMPALSDDKKTGFRTVVRLDATGDILQEDHMGYKVISDFSIEITETATADPPPQVILDALGKLTLYRMQEKAQEAIEDGNVDEATRRLENLATRLLANGEDELARAAITAAQQVARTSMLSEEGQKTLKYGTRALLIPSSSGQLEKDSS